MTCYRTCCLAISYIMLITVFVHSKNLENFVEEENPKLTDQFVIKVEGGPEVAKHLARKHGFIYLNRIIGDFYHLKQKKVTKRSLSSTIRERAALKNEPMVQYFEQQVAKRRVKRDFRADATSPPISSADQLTKLNDPRWPLMWYLNRGNDLDMNVQAAWAQGITGKGIVVTILDDGLEKDHPDILENYDEDASYDVNNHDGDPQPRYDIIDSNRHGTRCAGEVAATANNSICAVGIAYHAKVGGVRMLDGDVTDAVEAQSLSLNSNHVDIYSASWGPDDDGKTVDGPGPLASTAFKEGIAKGRHGLGSIFVWASGNGGREHDNCNCDGYTNSMWTLSISSATENGLVPWYSEACSSTLATTYSSGANGEKQIVTTDLHHGCTSTHTGTSASAPLAAGICALALEANKKLTWRDMQHIVVRAARPANLHAKDWAVNGVGRNVSHSFGYGLMDASAMVSLAQKWKTAPVQKLCEIKSNQQDQLIPAKSHVKLTLYVRCSNVRHLEHVQAKVSLSATRRGDIHVYLTSPMGTRSTLLAQRPLDGSRAGFQSWPFMTVHNWGEDPDGLWTLEVHNEGRYYGRATLKEWYLHLYGTTENPDGFRKTTTTTTTTVPTSTTAETTTIFSTPNATIVSLKPIPQSTKLKAPPWPQPTVQYYPTTSTTKHPPYSLEDGRHMEGDNKITPANRKVAAQETGCPKGNFFYHGHCVRQCPSGHYGSVGYNYRSSTSQELTTSTCLRCHYSCIECHGPNDYQCVLCHGDALLIDGYCEPKLLVDEVHTLSVWNHVVIGVFTALCVLTVCITVYVLVSFWPPPCSNVWCCKGNRKNRRDFASMQPHSQRREQARTFLPMTSQACGTNNHDRNVRLKPYYDTDEDL